jgi:putative signal transducing protein
MSAVTVAVVPNEAEADIILGLLRANGIEASHRGSAMNQSVLPMSGSAIEVFVDESDAAQARELLGTDEAARE